MGTTAQKLTYLNDTKGLLKNSINSLGGEITSQTTFRQYATELDSIYSNLPKVSETGSNISLTPTLKGRLGSTLKGNTLQDGTPSPSSPVEIQSATGLQNINVCGKNLFDKNSAEVGKFVNASGVIASDNSALVSDFIRITPNINYYISGRTSWNSIGLYNSNKTFLERINLNYTNGILNITNSNCAYIRINASSDNFNTLQLEVGSTATTYEAYQSQEYEINLGKNLLKTTNATITGTNYNVSINDGLISLENTHANCSIDLCGGLRNGAYLPTYANANDYHLTRANNGKYKLSIANFNADIEGTENTLVNIYTNQRAIGCYFSTSGVLNGTTSFTLQDGEYVKSVYLWLNGANTYNSASFNLQLEKGSQATSYSPYFTPIKLNKIGDNQDTITGTPDNWSIKRQIGSVVLDGSESSWLENSATKGLFQVTLSNVYFNNNTINAISNLLIGNTGTNIVQASNYTDNSIATFSGNRLFFRLNDYAENLVGFKTFLASNNMIVNYVLATETTETITNQEIINQLNEIYYLQSYNGTTNITITSEDLELIMTASALKGEE